MPGLKQVASLVPQPFGSPAPFKTHSTTVPKRLPSRGCIENAPALVTASSQKLSPPERSRYSTNSYRLRFPDWVGSLRPQHIESSDQHDRFPRSPFVAKTGWKDSNGGSIRGRVMAERSLATLSPMPREVATFGGLYRCCAWAISASDGTASRPNPGSERR
jgi:hypothetical protein